MKIISLYFWLKSFPITGYIKNKSIRTLYYNITKPDSLAFSVLLLFSFQDSNQCIHIVLFQLNSCISSHLNQTLKEFYFSSLSSFSKKKSTCKIYIFICTLKMDRWRYITVILYTYIFVTIDLYFMSGWIGVYDSHHLLCVMLCMYIRLTWIGYQIYIYICCCG